jgi:hypothetical protein
MLNEIKFLATHLNNGPTEPAPAQPQQHPQQQQQQQAPPATITNKRPAPSNPVNAQAPPIENGLDYRGHHPMNSNQQPPSSASSHGSNIRFRR